MLDGLSGLSCIGCRVADGPKRISRCQDHTEEHLFKEGIAKLGDDIITARTKTETCIQATVAIRPLKLLCLAAK